MTTNLDEKEKLKAFGVRFVAVDPGDAWCGVAALELRGSLISAFTTVIHATPRTMHETVSEIMRCSPSGLIVEKYQQRAVGHQRWAEPKAPRLLGALQYVAEDEGLGFHTVPTGDPRDVERMPFWPIIMQWRSHWQRGMASNWSHGLSAWRILGTFMMQHKTYLERLSAFRDQKQHILSTMWYQPVTWLGNMRTVSERDLTSTPVMWRMKV